MKIDLSYSNIMPKLSKITIQAKNYKDLQKSVIELFENIQSVDLGNDYEPSAIHENCREMARFVNCGAKR